MRTENKLLLARRCLGAGGFQLEPGCIDTPCVESHTVHRVLYMHMYTCACTCVHVNRKSPPIARTINLRPACKNRSVHDSRPTCEFAQFGVNRKSPPIARTINLRPAGT